MTSPSQDGAAEVRTALREILREYGAAGLDDAKLVATLLPDLLAASPREAKLILAATSAGVAGILRTRQAQGLTLPSAIRDAAVMLAQDSMIDAAMCDWIVTEFASALGYPTATTSMPDPTSSPPARSSDPVVRSNPTVIDPSARPLPPTRVAAPPGYSPGYSPAGYSPPGYSPGISPGGFSPAPPMPVPQQRVPYPSRPSYAMAPPPVVLMRPPPKRSSSGVVWVVAIAVIAVVGLCGGYAWYTVAAGNAAKNARTHTLSYCLPGTWRASTDTVTVTMADGTEVPTMLTRGTVTRNYLSTLDESVIWTGATYTGTYKGKPVVVEYNGSAFYPVTTSGTDTIHVSARTLYINVKLTTNGKTTSQDSVDLLDTYSRVNCDVNTLTVYNTDNSVRSTWVKLSST